LLFGSLVISWGIKGRRAAVVPGVAAVPPHRLRFQEGLKSLYEFTPEGYARAIELFNQASVLAPENCEYRLHAAQAQLFLALERKLNREDFRESWDKGADPGCAPGTSFSLRLEAFGYWTISASFVTRTALARINQAIELSPDNVFNRVCAVENEAGPADR
jgi:hypothetical protein